MDHKKLVKVGTLVMILLAFEVPGFNCNTATDDDWTSALEEFATVATVEKKFEISSISQTNRSTPIESDWWDKWERPKRLQQWFPIYKLGTLDDGVPIYVSLNGRFNFTELADQGSEEEKAALEPYFDAFLDGMRADSEVNGGNGVVIIVDWEGLSTRNFRHPAAIRLAIRPFAKLGKLYNVLKRMYMINTSLLAKTIMSSSNPYYGKLLETNEVYGTQRDEWVPQLRRSIPEHLLPVKYGGKNENIQL